MMSMIPDCQQTSDSVGWFAADDGGGGGGGGRQFRGWDEGAVSHRPRLTHAPCEEGEAEVRPTERLVTFDTDKISGLLHMNQYLRENLLAIFYALI